MVIHWESLKTPMTIWSGERFHDDRGGNALRTLLGSSGGVVDEDLQSMTREQLIVEATGLRRAIRVHRDSTGQDLCWHHPALWGLLPEHSDPLPAVPAWPEFLRGCLHYRKSLDRQLPDGQRAEAPDQP